MMEVINKLKRKLKGYFQLNKTKKFVSLIPEGEVKGRVLLSYLLDSFLYKENENPYQFHSSRWECWCIGQTFLELGYIVDVIDWLDKDFLPKHQYNFFIDIHYNLERIAPLINQDCVKILHITGAHWLFQNTAEYSRLLALQERRGFTLTPRRIMSGKSLAIQYADLATILGNEFTQNTFKFAKKSLYRIPISSSVTFPFSESKNYQDCRRTFLWIGSTGMVHKGLDLVLETFKSMPDFNLIVCGSLKKETDFEQAYYKELYQTNNIKTKGWVNILSDEFKKIIAQCIGIIYPSCSEGGGGSVITCLHGGLIPIVTYESSVDIDDFGFLLKETSISAIKNAILQLDNLSENELKEKSLKAWEYARKNHTKENFSDKYNTFVNDVLLKKSFT